MIDKVITHSGGADAESSALKEKILSAKDNLGNGNKTYYVSERGDDSNDGLSPEKPIKSYLHIADLPLEAGDSVLLERGSVFRISEMLWVKSGVCYGAYGEGEKPRVYGSLRDYADPSIWKQTDNKNIWQTELSHTAAALITFNYDEYIGVWKYTKPELMKDGDFYHDAENGVFYLYFGGGNPGEVFENIEISSTDVSIRGSYIENVKIENIYFKYNTVGAFLFGEIKGISISGCVMGWGGGKIFEIREKGPLRYGNAAEFWYQCEDISVENCWIYQQFDAALTFQGEGADTPIFHNIKFDNNLIEYCSMNIEYWAGQNPDGTPALIENISYKGNIIRFAGYGWGGIYRWDKEDQASLLGWNYLYENVKNFVVTENIIDCADCYMIYMKSGKEQKGLSVFNNTYYQKSVSGTHDCIETVKGLDLCASNQEEFENAITEFEEKPKLIKWLN